MEERRIDPSWRPLKGQDLPQLSPRSLKLSESEGDSQGEQVRPRSKFPAKSERDVLLRKVRSVLNKISSMNYHGLRKRWLSLLPNTNEGIGEVLTLLVAKALDDQLYMALYARLLGQTCVRKPEVAGSIRAILNTQVLHELKKLTTDKEMAKFSKSEEEEARVRHRKVSLHRFIAELYCEKSLSTKFILDRASDLLVTTKYAERRGGDADEDTECLCVLLTFAGWKLADQRGQWLDEVFVRLGESAATSARVHFMLLDLVDMRAKGWVPHNKWWCASVRIQDPPPHRDLPGKLRALWNKLTAANFDRLVEVAKKAFVDEEDFEDLDFLANQLIQQSLLLPQPALGPQILSGALPTTHPLRNVIGQSLANFILESPEEDRVKLFGEFYTFGLVTDEKVGVVVERLFELKLLELLCVFFLIGAEKIGKDWKGGRRWFEEPLKLLEQKVLNGGSPRAVALFESICEIKGNGWMPRRPFLKARLETEKKIDAALVISSYLKSKKESAILLKNFVENRADGEKFFRDAMFFVLDQAMFELKNDPEKLKRLVQAAIINMKSVKQRFLSSSKNFNILIGRIVGEIACTKEEDGSSWVLFGKIMEEIQ